jgi:hypothetical protein
MRVYYGYGSWVRFFALGIIIWAVFGIGIGASATENKGAPTMVLEGGSSGSVPFPHLKHQQALNDCNLCHDIFGQEKGIIERLKAEGKLINKQVMNKKCISCHRERKADNKPAGPILCTECHKRG